ncbi:MAG: 4'-phosphopantetheinyl transferase superfamily protein [Prevotellaceae bacterium]|jgi:phosphopantetheine--protein transferase-like protein|nr:4'-phosphopantetheinyl transferase superfamily protein [Prevotellaceae bacterium]
MPLYKKEEFKDGGVLAVWQITETEDDLKIIAATPTAEQENIEQMSAGQRRLESYAVRALLTEIFDERVYIGYEEDDSPYIKNTHHKISISHSGEFACIYVHQNANVGIDIESLSRNFDAVAKKILSDNESEYLTEKYRQKQLAIIWSAKESVYKLMGKRNIDFSKQIQIEKFIPHDPEGELNAIFIDSEANEHELELYYQIFDGYEMVWVAM